MARLLVVDGDVASSSRLGSRLEALGYQVSVCDTAATALGLIESQSPEAGSGRIAIVLADAAISRSGVPLTEELQRRDIAVPVLLCSNLGSDSGAVDRALRCGVVDVIVKSCPDETLAQAIENILKLSHFPSVTRQVRFSSEFEVVHSCRAMQDLMAQVELVAKSEVRVCILGETGVGKELIARALHEHSNRHTGRFVAFNCAAIPGELIESELFGHEKGSFSGAIARHIGKFEQANGGTLFIDEIGDMPLFMQAKLLRVLEDSKVERVGGAGPVPVDVRVVSATHRDLAALVRKAGFRQDLYYRVNVFPLRVPPLRERLDDIPALAEHLALQVSRQNGWKAKQFSATAIAELQRYPWPGNVRELRNVVERLMLVAADPVEGSDVRHVLPVASETVFTEPMHGSLAQRVAVFEREQILAELRRRNFIVTAAAGALGLNRSHLYKKCQELEIDIRALRDTEDD